MGAPNEAQSDTVKAVRAMQDADRAGAVQPGPPEPGWADARTIQMIVGGGRLLFEVIRAESGDVEQVVDVLPSGGLRIRPKCGVRVPPQVTNAPVDAAGRENWLHRELACMRHAGHEPPHRVEARPGGPYFEWQSVEEAARWAAADAERRDAAPGVWEERQMGDSPAPAALEVAQHDAAIGGVGYLVDGVPVQPQRVRVVRGQVPQRQDALASQLRDVAVEATRMGCYDAADFIGRRLAG